MPVLEDTDTVGNEEDIETVVEEVVKDSLPQNTIMLKYELHTTCLLTLKTSYIASVRKSFSSVQPDTPPP